MIEDGACLDSNQKEVNSESTTDKSNRLALIPRETERRDTDNQSIIARGTLTVIVGIKRLSIKIRCSLIKNQPRINPTDLLHCPGRLKEVDTDHQSMTARGTSTAINPVPKGNK